MSNHKQRYDWETIRAEYEAGSTMGELSNRHGVDKSAISRRARKEGWLQDVTGAVNRLVDAKVNGIVNTVDPKKKLEALNNAANEKVAVVNRHKQEWAEHKQLVTAAQNASTDKEAFEKAKLAKIIAETIKIRQEGERKAWGIVDSVQKSDVEILPLYTLLPEDDE